MANYYSGLHHDYLHGLEKSGRIKTHVIKSHADGYYQANVITAETVSPNHAFFPSEWSREDVLNKALEIIALVQDPVRAEQYPNLNRYICYGHDVIDFPIDQHVYIRIVIKNGAHVQTVFPVFI